MNEIKPEKQDAKLKWIEKSKSEFREEQRMAMLKQLGINGSDKQEYAKEKKRLL